MSLIEISNLSRDYVVRQGSRLRGRRETVHAVHDISLRVEEGEAVGYIGPNGAGKSTTIKMLTGILSPTAGQVRVAGLEPSRQRVALARRIGVVFGQRSTLWWDLPLRDSFTLLRHLYRIPEPTFRANLERFTDLLDMADFLGTPVRQLSLGQRMRGELVAALLHDPAILFLDEPTIGLDVVSKTAVRGFLAQLNAERRTTILLTTHDLADIERLCRRIVLIDAGTVAFDGSLADLRDQVEAERTLVLDLAEPTSALDIPGTRVVSVDGPRQTFAFPATVSANQVIAAATARATIVDLSLREPDIDDVVRQLYQRTRSTVG